MRPLADRIVLSLLHSPLTPVQVTLTYSLVGAVAGWLILRGSFVHYLVAAMLLMVKNLLDSVDGGLARTRHRPSRVGRLLDSLADFFINAWVIYAMVSDRFLLALAALTSITLQGTFYNYFVVLYRHATGGDTTSGIREGWESPFAYDSRCALVWLVVLYKVIYGWQDAIAFWLDGLLTAGRRPPPTPGFLTMASFLGLGIHLAVMALALVVGNPIWAVLAFVAPFNIFLVMLLLVRYVSQFR